MSNPKIIIITQGLSPIVPPITDKYSVVGIVEAAPRKKHNSTEGRLIKLSRWLYRLVNLRSKSLQSFCGESGIPYYLMNAGSDKSLGDWVIDKAPDLLCIYSMSELLQENIFSIPPLGTINLHPSLLPKYRGPNPYFWIILNEETESGPTIHYIDKDEDTGDILAQEAFTLCREATITEIQSQTVALGVQLMIKIIDRLSNGCAEPIKQPQKSPTARARLVKPDEYYGLIQWEQWSVQRIWRLFHSGAFRLSDVFPNISGARWKECEPMALESMPRKKARQVPGTLSLESGVYVLSCMDGVILFKGHYGFKQILSKLIGR